MHIDPTTQSVLVFALLALAAPIATHLLGRWVLVPSLVFEIVLGIIVGPDALDWAKPTEVVTRLSDIGMLLLFFIAGTEINAAALRGRTGRMAWLGWLISFAVGVGIGFVVAPGLGGVIIGISRALGETAPLVTIGALSFIAFLPPAPVSAEFPFVSFAWLFEGFTVLPIQAFNWVSRPGSDFHSNAAAAGLVLLAITLLLNGIAIYFRYRLRKKLQW